MVKLFCTEMRDRVADRCAQLHGEFGEMPQLHPISALYNDAGVASTYGVSSEVMKLIVAQSLGI
jgi:acyl-CoA dehydrogenase